MLVLVVGPPRSGTSVVARILHEKVGICMGHNLVPGNAGNPLGFYEDPKMVAATKTKDVFIWARALYKVHGHSSCKFNFGVKTPELAFMNMIELCPDIVIRPRRHIHDIAASLLRWQQPRIDYHSTALALAMKYEDAIDRQVPELIREGVYHPIMLLEKRDEKDLERELKGLCASVIQRLEARPLKPESVGSNPAGGTK